MAELTINSVVISKKDLPFALSEGIDVPKGTRGVVKGINEGGPEGKWLHVLWEVGGSRGKTPHNVNPSDVELDQDPLDDPKVQSLLYGPGGPFGPKTADLTARKTVVKQR